MAVGVSCSDALAEGLEGTHLGLDPATGMVPGPALPEGPAIMPGGAQGLVSGNRRRAVLFLGAPVLADRYDRRGLAVEDGGVAAASVIGGHCANLFALGDLAEQFRQDRAVTVAAGGELHGANVRSGRVHGQMDLAPLASALDPMLVHLPLAVPEKLDSSAVHRQVPWTISPAEGDLDRQCFLPPAQDRVVRHGPLQVRHLQQAGHHPGRLPQREFE